MHVDLLVHEETGRKLVFDHVSDSVYLKLNFLSQPLHRVITVTLPGKKKKSTCKHKHIK